MFHIQSETSEYAHALIGLPKVCLGVQRGVLHVVPQSWDQTIEYAHALAELPAAKHLSWKVVRATVLAVWIAKRYEVSKFAAGVWGLSSHTPGVTWMTGLYR